MINKFIYIKRVLSPSIINILLHSKTTAIASVFARKVETYNYQIVFMLIFFLSVSVICCILPITRPLYICVCMYCSWN